LLNGYVIQLKTRNEDLLIIGRILNNLLNWSELDETFIIGAKLTQITTKRVRKIQEHIKVTQSQQKIHARKK